MPSAPATIIFVLAALAQEMSCISVPTGKKTPITPAKVTPRPTYHPPAAHPAPVREYTEDNPEPAPLNPSWIPIPVKYLNVLTANSILYVPMRIPNPALQPTYASSPLKEAAGGQVVQATEPTAYLKATDQQVYGVKVAPKQKWKPYYYLPKNVNKYATKGGYPKKAVAAPSEKFYFYYPYQVNSQ